MAFRAELALWTNLWCLNLTRPLEILGLSTDPTAFILQIGTNKINWSWRLHLYNKKQIPGITRQTQQILSLRRCDHDICRNRRTAVLNKWKVSVTTIRLTREALLGKDRANKVLSKQMPFIFSVSKFIILLSVRNWFIAGFPYSK